MWFHYHQNNSGGSFDVDENVAHDVFIEAGDLDIANFRAESIGIYFNGCDSGMDCECCGDRWYPPYDAKGDDKPVKYGKSIYEIKDGWFGDESRLHHADGRVEAILNHTPKVKP